MLTLRNCDCLKTEKDIESREVAERSKMKQCAKPQERDRCREKLTRLVGVKPEVFQDFPDKTLVRPAVSALSITQLILPALNHYELYLSYLAADKP